MPCFRSVGSMEDDEGELLLKADVQVEYGHEVPESVIRRIFMGLVDSGEEGSVVLFLEKSGKSYVYRG